MKRFTTAIALLFAMVISFTAIAWAGDLPELKFEKFVLSNGLNVILHEDHSIPIVSVNVWYHVGSKNEKPGKTGFAHLFEHLMFQGSQNHNALFAEGIAKIGGQNNGSTSEDCTNYWENIPSDYLEKALWLEADRMNALLPAIDQKRLDNQRDVVKNERRESYENQPYGWSREWLASLIFPKGHPYSWMPIGSMEDLSAASLEDVQEFFRKYYAPNNASLCIAGDLNPAQAKEWVNKYFAAIPPGPPIERMESWIPTLSGIKRMKAEDNVSLPRITMVWPTPSLFAPGDAEFDLLASILASGRTSRLYKTLVYDKQMAQVVRAYQGSRELSSVFNITITAKQGVSLDDIEREVDLIIKDIQTNGVKPDELERSRTNWEADFVRGLQQVGGFGGRADRLNAYNVRLGDPGKLLWDRDRYTKGTAADVQTYAKKYLNLNDRAILQIYPRGKLAADSNKPDMTVEPQALPEPSFTPPTVQKATLANGLEIQLVEDHRLPLVQFNLLFKSGWAADPVGKSGIASLTAAMLTEGTKSRNSLKISDDIQRLGADLATGTLADNSTVSLDILKRSLDPALELMSDIVLNPTFPQEELDRRKLSLQGQIQQEMRQPYPTGRKFFVRELYGADHPYGQPPSGIGTAKSIQEISRTDLLDFYKANYLPNSATAILVGDITMAEAKLKLEKAFGNWKPGNVAQRSVNQVKPPSKTKVVIVDKPGAVQSLIFLGNIAMPRSSGDYLPASVMCNVLGGGSTARLYTNLRQDKGYTYGSYSFINFRRGQGYLAAYAQVQTEVTKEALIEFLKEFRGIAGEKPIDAAELADKKNNMIKSFPQGFETYGGIADQIGTMLTFGLPDDEWKSYIGRINAVTPEAAMKSARDYVDPNALLIVVVGDRAKIEPRIREVNLGEITFPSADEM
ncbi:MAG: insulinase family protein [Candidatus Zixiibacteriota bacterium]|nr:MAG: insulinase family protein [candidate division Zixibacteria bacterium]